MNTQNALQVLIQAVQTANLKGAFSLQDSALIAQAVEVFTKKPEEANSYPVSGNPATAPVKAESKKK